MAVYHVVMQEFKPPYATNFKRMLAQLTIYIIGFRGAKMVCFYEDQSCRDEIRFISELVYWFVALCFNNHLQ